MEGMRGGCSVMHPVCLGVCTGAVSANLCPCWSLDSCCPFSHDKMHLDRDGKPKAKKKDATHGKPKAFTRNEHTISQYMFFALRTHTRTHTNNIYIYMIGGNLWGYLSV